jgi:hypothetical protein
MANPLPADDYWFSIKYTEDGIPKEFKSHFSLKDKQFKILNSINVPISITLIVLDKNGAVY